jgi:DNA polymerase (family X)
VVQDGVLELLSAWGLRPEKAMQLYKNLGISSLAELEAAAKADHIKKTRGLGAALQTKILQNLVIARSGAGRLHVHRAALLEHAVASLHATQPELRRITVAGNLRRGCELVADMSIVAEGPSSGDPRNERPGQACGSACRPQALRRCPAVCHRIRRAS